MPFPFGFTYIFAFSDLVPATTYGLAAAWCNARGV